MRRDGHCFREAGTTPASPGFCGPLGGLSQGAADLRRLHSQEVVKCENKSTVVGSASDFVRAIVSVSANVGCLERRQRMFGQHRARVEILR
jgi:hypothetical protein